MKQKWSSFVRPESQFDIPVYRLCLERLKALSQPRFKNVAVALLPGKGRALGANQNSAQNTEMK